MSLVWTVAKKELRGYFNSAVAVIFLAAFLAVTFYTFFWYEKFFARGLADLRPLFEWLPRLLIIVVSALSMRLWADERKAGTLEVLLTLPIPRVKLVLGKFVAGMLLIAVALALTLELPLTISHLGKLDAGPVIGGYLAALLLSAAYLSIGMCVSALTDNQIVAFLGTAVVCVIFYVIGDFGAAGHFLGTGARFESVARGVIDLRDLAYYASIFAIGIALNVLLLQRLTWGHGARAKNRRLGAILGVVLVGVNAIALDVWLAPVHRARVDLTHAGAYSLSKATVHILDTLDEHIVIHGYFSDKTHPKLEPLQRQLVDLLEEYQVAGNGKVRVEFVDPTDTAQKKEIKERFGIESTTLRFATENEKSEINAYFTIAIEYGDHHVVLGLDDLIQVRSKDIGDIEVALKNPEYQITKTIKKTVSEFSSVDALFASMPGKVELTAYITPTKLPDNWKDGPAKLKAITDKLAKQSNNKLVFTQVEPKTEAEVTELFQKYGLRPYQDLLSGDLVYFHLILKVGDRVVRVVVPESISGNELDNAITEGLKRAAPGFTRVVGMWTPPEPPQMPPDMEGMPPQRQPPPPQTYKLLERALASNYEMRDVTLYEPVPDEVEALVLAGPEHLDPAQQKNLDQFVMRGGALVALAGRYRLAPAEGLAIAKVQTGIESLLKAWGITLGDDVVLDSKAEVLPIPVDRDLREIRQLAYPYFVRLDGSQLSDSPITSDLAGAVMNWPSPVKADDKVGEDAHEVDALLTSSPKSWLKNTPSAEPNLEKFPDSGFPGPEGLEADKLGPQVLAVSVTGGFASGIPKDDKDKPASAAKKALLAHSPPDTRVVVFGSSSFVSDEMQQIAQQLQSDLATSDIELVHNAVDWSLADTDLLSIRSRTGASALTVEPEDRGKWRMINIVIGVVLLIGVVLYGFLRRSAVQPIVRGEA